MCIPFYLKFVCILLFKDFLFKYKSDQNPGNKIILDSIIGFFDSNLILYFKYAIEQYIKEVLICPTLKPMS